MKSFHVCIARPANFPHAMVFYELGELLRHSAREIGYVSTMSFNRIMRNSHNVLIGCHILNMDLIKEIPKSTIIFNTEQIFLEETSRNERIYEWARNFQMWDYSHRNIEKFNSLGLNNVKHLRIGYQKELKRIVKSENRDIDVLFYGSLNHRRSQILKELRSKGLKVESLFNVFGKERDEFIARSKVVLNHHFFEAQIFEVVRVFYLLSNEIAVVGEVNPTTIIEDRWRDAICAAPYERLVDEVCRLVADDAARVAVEKNGLAEIKKYPQARFTAEVLEPPG